MFYLEEPSIARKQEALDYLEEHIKYGSNINGTGGMDNILDGMTYEEWLIKLEKMKDAQYAKSINRCPGKTYFLIRREDNKIVGMINIRHNLNDAMLKFGGHIGYGIRPSERRKGYNKINLYLGLKKVLDDFGLKKVMLDCTVDNIGSDKTIRALGGILERCEVDPTDNDLTNVYWIDVEESLVNNYDKYEQYVDKNFRKK